MSPRVHATAFALMGLLAAALAGGQDYPTISYKDASDHIGEIAWVEGTVLRTEQAPEGTYLLFSADEKYVRILVPKANVDSFEGSLQHRYSGKKLKAIGKITRYGYKLILGVNEPKRIRLEEGTN